MELGLKGRHVAILAADGVDGSQVAGSRRALGEAGAVAEVLAFRGGQARGTAGDPIPVDRALDAGHAAEYDALVIPGGRAGADALARDERAVQLVREFMAADKPVAAIGEGVRLLAAADAVAGRSVAAPPELERAIREAGGEVVDAAVHVDEKLITSRGAGDLRAVQGAILREFANRLDEARVDELSEQSFPASDPPPGPVSVGGEGASTALHLDPRRPPGQTERGPGDEGARA